MWHFDWGVFWAVIGAFAVAFAFRSGGLDPDWLGKALKRHLELQERQIELQQEQLTKQEEILDKLPF